MNTAHLSKELAQIYSFSAFVKPRLWLPPKFEFLSFLARFSSNFEVWKKHARKASAPEFSLWPEVWKLFQTFESSLIWFEHFMYLEVHTDGLSINRLYDHM